LHGKDEELAGVQFMASPKTKGRRGNDGEEMVVVALSESDAQAWRERNESRGRCGGGRWGSSLFIAAVGGRGWPVVRAEEWPVLMGMKWLAINWWFTLWIKGGGRGNECWMRCDARCSASMAG
jgi:hypothetical protein